MKNLLTILTITGCLALASCGRKTQDPIDNVLVPVMGEKGDKGNNGTDGTNGTNGSNGTDGADGATGATGTDGADGTNGTNGADGVDGTDGTNGTDGTDGADASESIVHKADIYMKNLRARCPTCPGIKYAAKVFTGMDNFIVVANSTTSGASRYHVVDLTNYDTSNDSGDTGHASAELVIDEVTTFGGVGPQTLYFPTNLYKITSGPLAGSFLEESSTSKKDLESLGANKESLGDEELIYNLEENYGLSEERAQSVAKITSSFQKIQNKRALTAKEMNIYTQKVLGVDYTASKKALEKHIQGDSSEMEALMERAAELNNTSPEAVQDLVGEYLLK